MSGVRMFAMNLQQDEIKASEKTLLAVLLDGSEGSTIAVATLSDDLALQVEYQCSVGPNAALLSSPDSDT